MIPAHVMNKIQNGQALLFLGAGASMEARDKSGNRPPSGDDLKNLLSDKFLGGKKKDTSLSYVAELAKNESCLREVQSYIADIIEPYEPSEFHQMVTKFRWRGIFTTNYDLLLEKSYEKCPDSLQTLEPFFRDSDDFGEKLRSQTALPYFKLHGCISTINDPELPLILATEEYAKYEKNRKRLFGYLKEWGRDYPIIFCGYNLSDPNIQFILFDIGDNTIDRPAYININPSLDDLEISYWGSRRVTPVKATFGGFLKYIDNHIPYANRQLSMFVDTDTSTINKWISSADRPSGMLMSYLKHEIDHVFPGMVMKGVVPCDFYHGLERTWDVYDRELDVRRRITDDLLINAVIDVEDEFKCILLKGHAGSGKDVVLDRFAWEAAKELEQLVFVLKEGGILRYDLLLDIYHLTKTRLIIVVGDGLKHAKDISNLIIKAKQGNIPLSVVIGARTNEWNIYGEGLEKHIDESYELRDLSEKEIHSLLNKLEDNNCLGYLASLSPEKRMHEVKEKLNRQILVALHEITEGKPFETIVLDEYNRILPEEARKIYLDICTLHRLDVPIRAGLLSRVSGISFDKFKERMLKPLEHVVRLYKDEYSRDYMYVSRHPIIAKCVFEQAMRDPEDRSAQIKRIIQYLNISYQPDEIAFNKMIKGKVLADLFADRRHAEMIFSTAENIGASMSHVLHQRAVFELTHRDGQLAIAQTSIQNAEKNTDHGRVSILHTKAAILRRRAQVSLSILERERLQQEAIEILEKQRGDSYSLHLLAQIQLDKLVSKLDELENEEGQTSQLSKRVIAGLVEEADKSIQSGLQKYVDSEHWLTLQSELATIVQDTPLVKESLKIAHHNTPESGPVAVRLANFYLANDDEEGAKRTLENCLSKNPSSKGVHFLLAKILIDNDEQDYDKVIHHLKNSYTEGDSNINAQIWSARHHYLFGDKKIAKRIFNTLRSTRLSNKVRNKIIGVVRKRNSIEENRFSGRVKSCNDNYCFVRVIELADDIFIHYSSFPEDQWPMVEQDKSVTFSIGFSAAGIQGINATAV